jgi:hypothetical protein
VKEKAKKEKAKEKGRRYAAAKSWEVWLAKLKKYKAAHGDCSVPEGWAGLGSWVSDQRARKRKLDRGDGQAAANMTAEQAAKLEALGFAWEGSHSSQPDDAGWEGWLAQLKKYKAAHGDCSVPQRWAEDPWLGSWVNDQRKYKKKMDRGEPSEGMTAARVGRLDALGFAWELSAAAISKQRSKGRWDDAGWEAQLAKLTAYKSARGDCNVPQRWAEDPPLGRWVVTQRTCKKKLDRGEPNEGMTAARAAKLDALGFVWAPRGRSARI